MRGQPFDVRGSEGATEAVRDASGRASCTPGVWARTTVAPSSVVAAIAPETSRLAVVGLNGRLRMACDQKSGLPITRNSSGSEPMFRSP